MSQRLRTILFICFIGGFFIITPLVMLYAAGYKLNPESRKMQKTGMISVETEPKGARVYINDKLQEKASLASLVRKAEAVTTPAKIKNLLPGEYKLSVETDGYWGWERKVNIYPGQSLNLEDIILVRKDLPLLVTEGNADLAQLSPNRGRYLYRTGENLSVYDIGNDSSLGVASNTNEAITWSSQGDKVIIGQTVYDLSGNGSGIDLAEALGKNYSLLRFDSQDNNIVYFTRNRSIFRLKIGENTADKIIELSAEPDDIKISGDELIYLTRTANKAFVNFYSLEEAKATRIIEVPYSQKFQFIWSRGSAAGVMDAERKTLYLIDPSAFSPIVQTLNEVSGAYWIDDNSFIYTNGFEIWKADTSGGKWLLTRLSQPIKNAIWHPSGKFIIFTNEKSLSILDIEGLEKKTIELIKMDSISVPALDNAGDSVYFFGTLREQKGIYKLRLK